MENMENDDDMAGWHQLQLEEQEQSELDETIEKLEELNKRQNKRFNLQEKDKCYLQKRQAKISP